MKNDYIIIIIMFSLAIFSSPFSRNWKMNMKSVLCIDRQSAIHRECLTMRDEYCLPKEDLSNLKRLNNKKDITCPFDVFRNSKDKNEVTQEFQASFIYLNWDNILSEDEQEKYEEVIPVLIHKPQIYHCCSETLFFKHENVILYRNGAIRRFSSLLVPETVEEIMLFLINENHIDNEYIVNKLLSKARKIDLKYEYIIHSYPDRILNQFIQLLYISYITKNNYEQN